MNHVRRFGQFWWDFVVGEDWTVALGVAVGLALTWVAAHNGENWFWLMPVVVLSMLAMSLWRRTVRRSDRSRPQHTEGREVSA